MTSKKLENLSYNFNRNRQNTPWILENCSLIFVILDFTMKSWPEPFCHREDRLFEMFVSKDLLGIIEKNFDVSNLCAKPSGPL